MSLRKKLWKTLLKYVVSLAYRNQLLEVRFTRVWFLFRHHVLLSLNTLEPSGHYMYRTVVTICTASLTVSISTFCPRSVFMFCVDLRTNSDYFPTQH